MCVSCAIAKQLRRDLDLLVMWLEQSITHTLQAELARDPSGDPSPQTQGGLRQITCNCERQLAGSMKVERTRLQNTVGVARG